MQRCRGAGAEVWRSRCRCRCRCRCRVLRCRADANVVQSMCRGAARCRGAGADVVQMWTWLGAEVLSLLGDEVQQR